MTDKTNFKQSALLYHTDPVPGKLEIRPTKAMANKQDLSLAYSPGVAHACEYIVEDPTNAARVTARGNLVAVVSNGTAVLGLGNIGPLASKPVMEGKAVLFKKFANIDVFDIEVAENDVDRLVDVVAALEPTFGGINLEDIKAPECFLVERKLRERMNIPVFHDDQHGTAIVAAAAVYNALKIVKKKIGKVKLVVSGAGAASIACVDLLVSMGLDKKNVFMIDRSGVIYEGRQSGMNPWKQKYANPTSARTLDDAIDGADIFMGLSGPGVLNQAMVRKMAKNPLILAMSNPVPEIMPEDALAVRPDAILATGRSDYPNQVNNVLCFPFIFRGALDCGATTINEEMKQACVKAIAELAEKEATDIVAQAYHGESLIFGRDYLIPKPFDPRLIEEVPVAVVEAAMASGVATRPVQDMEAYRQKLRSYVVRSGLFMQPVVDKAKADPARVVYAEGENDDVLRGVQTVVDEKIARPILIGRPAVIEKKIRDMGLRMLPDLDISIFNPEEGDYREAYWQYYHERVGREGVSIETAKTTMHTDNTVLAAVMVALGDADGMICGKVGGYHTHLKAIRRVLGSDDPEQILTSVCALILNDGPLFLADAFVNVDPDEQQLAATVRSSVQFVRNFGIEPRVALVSHSNFGTYDNDHARKMQRVAAQMRREMPDLQIDGEMNAYTALNPAALNNIYKNSQLREQANLLIMPNMDAGNIALGLLRSVAKAILVGPFLNGLSKPAHILIPSVSSRGIYNMSALAVADIQERRKQKVK